MNHAATKHGVEPVAIVGMSCRLPGDANSAEEFWQFLLDGGQATGPIPPERWEPYAAAARRATSQGGFITDAAGFDAEFFGVTPREAELMDPQQRIMLEVVWQALEHAGIPPSSLAGTDAGVFVGVGSDDYGRQMLEDLPRIEAWTGIGAAMCAVANRISYVLDLRGPSMAVDTACSASLVAIHLACTSVRAGESTVAIAAGVNLIAGPGLTMVLDAAGATAPDGRSKSFDASADGYGRGEGCGVLVLKRLSDAQRDRDRILAVIRGSAVNQDGRTNGIMAPSGPAQEHVVRQALRQAQIAPETVDYVEAHGTGTRTGDPIEVGALSNVYGRTGADGPCLIGSVKANIGHLEAGAGAAGVLKTVLALSRGELPPSVNFTTPNPEIPWDTCGLAVARERQPWPDRGPVRRAAVSSFGYGGTVGHVVLEQAPSRDAATVSDDPLPVYALSGVAPKAVRDYARRLADWLDGPGAQVNLGDVAHTLLVRRTHLPYRAAVVAADRAELRAKLCELGDDDIVRAIPADPVLVFSGHGSQWLGMGRELLATEPVFADVIDQLATPFAEELGWTPREALAADDLGGVDRIQPLIFAMQVGLAALWRSYGVRPAAVIGHSVGEIAAAVTAGAFDAQDGARLICRRSKLLRRVAGKGAMAMVPLPFDTVAERLAGRTDVTAAIAASPQSTVVSGTPDAVRELTDGWTATGRMVRPVASDVAFHSGQMDPLLDELAVAVDFAVSAPEIPMYSTALVDPRTPTRHDGRYWAANLRNPVRLASAVSAAAQDGHRCFVEVSSHPVVTHSIGETLDEAGVRDASVTATLRRDQPEQTTFLESLAELHRNGGTVDWSRRALGDLVTLPTIAWQHRPYWYTPSRLSRTGHDVDAHTLLGDPVHIAGVPSLRIWQTDLDHDSRPYPGSHPIHGVEIMPAAVLLNTFLAATGAATLTDISLRTPISVTSPRQVQVVHQDNGVRLASRLLDGDATADTWVTHTTGAASDAVLGGRFDVEGALARHREKLDPGAVLARLHEVGVADTGFHWKVERLTGADDGLLATVSAGNATWAALFDAILTVAPLAFPGEALLRMPSYVRELAVTGKPPKQSIVEVRLRGGDVVDVAVADRAGRLVARMAGVRFTPLGDDSSAPRSARRLVHRIEWVPLESDAEKPARRVTLVGRAPELARQFHEHFTVTAAAEPEELSGVPLASDVLVLPPVVPEDAIAGQAVDYAWRVAQTAQALAGSNADTRLWVVTTGLRETTDAGILAQAPAWGIGRVVAGEHPELWGGLVDLPTTPDSKDFDALASVLRARPNEDVISIRSGAAEVSRLVPIADTPVRPALACRTDAAYLITGGLGVLGLEVAGWLVGRGARDLILAGRTALPDRDTWDSVTDPMARHRIDAIRALEALGVNIRTVAMDITDFAVSRRQLDELPPIRGVVHAAGVLDNQLLQTLDEHSLRRVMWPKVAGAITLHRLFPPGSLDFLALFSSNGQLLGLTGQASYAAGNAFLDALARHRRTDTVSLAWTSWRGMGMSVSDAVDQELLDRGVGDISATEAFQAWALASQYAEPHIVVMPTVALEPGTRVRPILRLLEFESADGSGAADSGVELSGLASDELRERLADEVAQQVSTEMKLPAADLDVRRPLSELGLDSVMTVAIRRRLEKRLGVDIPATLLWTHPTVTAVADYLAERFETAS
jgi:6-methylsalicylic acid synthase